MLKYYRKEHATKFAELLREVDVACTKQNIKLRVDLKYGATQGEKDFAMLF